MAVSAFLSSVSASSPSLGEQRDAGTRGHEDLAPFQVERAARAYAINFCTAGPASSPCARSDRMTANSSPPRRHTVSSARRRLLEPLRDLLQQIVSGGVSQRVVHHFEVVEVDEHHRRRLDYCVGNAPAPAAVDRRTAGGSAGRSDVVVRQEQQALFRDLAHGDVLGDAGDQTSACRRRRRSGTRGRAPSARCRRGARCDTRDRSDRRARCAARSSIAPDRPHESHPASRADSRAGVARCVPQTCLVCWAHVSDAIPARLIASRTPPGCWRPAGESAVSLCVKRAAPRRALGFALHVGERERDVLGHLVQQLDQLVGEEADFAAVES